MNRIYQGKVRNVQFWDKEKKDWQDLKDWPQALWQHHQLFQDAVNYYTLALAALADGLPSDNKTALGWRDRVRESWQQATRKAERFDGRSRRD